jgi:hypothetical protein
MATKQEFLGINCDKCGSPMVPMFKKEKGFRCAAPGNKYNPSTGKWSVCDGVKWNKGNSQWVAKKPIERPDSFPVIATPTDEQREMYKLLSLAPDERGGRCLIYDAGPGTAKTTTASWSMEAVHARIPNLSDYGLRCFNTNAAEVLQSKLPAQVPNIATLNSAFGRAQGYRRNNYEKTKSFRIFKEMVKDINEKERPSFGKLGKVLERTRDCCLWAEASDTTAWLDIINATYERFPSLFKKCKGQEQKIATWLPALASACLSQRTKIDLQEQVTRPVTLAMQKSGWRMKVELVNKRALDWTDSDIEHFGKLVKAITIPSISGLIVDEAQDLSLAQIAMVLAQTFRTGELMLIGDDNAGNPGEPGYKAGQAIYGWRGAFSGSLTLIARLWEHLTGEEAIKRNLTITFRHCEKTCAAYRPLNTIIKSARELGYSAAYTVGGGTAFESWLNLPQGNTALWITRTNAAIVPVFLDTLRECQDCTIRGGGDFQAGITSALYDAAGVADEQGEYRVSLSACLTKLKEIVDEQAEEGDVDPNSLESFLLGIGEALISDPTMFKKAELNDCLPTVGNMVRFVTYFADRNSRRVLTTVYRCKGDEADLAIIADTSKFNESWGDACEDNACRHVAASRGKRLTLFIGRLSGTVAPLVKSEEDLTSTLAV